MSETFDAIVLGGGVIGCSSAYHLARKGMKVLLLEKDTLGGRTSGGTPGMLAAQEEAKEDGPFFELCVASRDLFADLVPEVRELSGTDPDWVTRGSWRVAETSQEASALLLRKEKQEARGHAVQWRTADELSRTFPFLGGPYSGALFFPRDGEIHSGKWVQALAEAARRKGAVIREQAVRAEVVFEKDRVLGVKTASEFFAAGRVLLAAGVWTPSLLEGSGLKISLEPVKGQLLILEGQPPLFSAPLFAGAGYFAPKVDGRFIVGTTQERGVHDARPTLEGLESLSAWARRWCPELKGRAVTGAWAGLRPAAADDKPLMGPVPGREGLFLSAGHFRNGVLLSPFSGRFMADGMADGIWDPRGKPFFPERLLAPAAAR